MVLGIGKKDLSLFIYSNFFKQVPRSIRRILIDICTLLMIVNSYVRFQIMDDYLLIVSCKYIITYHKYLKNAIIPGYTQFMCLYIGMYIYQVFLQLLQRILYQGYIVNASNFQMKSIFLYNSFFKILSDFKTIIM